MAIRVTPTVTSLNTAAHLHGKIQVSSVKSGSLAGTQCAKDIPGSCRSHVPAFAYLSDENDDYRNDIRSFIYEVPTGATIVGKLIDTLTSTEYTITDNTYGYFYNTGTIKANTWGFILRWFAVADTLGYGVYQFNVTITNSSATELTNYTSPCFDLKPWTCDDSHGTVKISTEQKGYIVDGFDYRGISYFFETAGGLGQTNKTSWPQELRWYGKLTPVKPTYVNDTIQDSNRNEVQVQSQIIKNYSLRLDYIYECLSEPFLTDMFLSGEIYISDYNTNNVNLYDFVRVNPVDISARENFPMSKNEFFTIDLEQYQKSTLKRH